MDSSRWTVVLLIWMQVATSNALQILSQYDRRLNLLKDVMTQDKFWQYVLKQHVYYNFNRKFYSHIIDEELLKGARGEPKPSTSGETSSTTGDSAPVTTDEASTDTEGAIEKTAVPPEPIGDPVVPINYLRNLFVNRFRSDSLVNDSLGLIHVAFKCLAYKHVSHLLTLVQKQISRTMSQRKAINWSAKSRESVGLIVVKMGSIQLSDQLLLLSMTFFRVYDKPTLAKAGNRFVFTPILNYLSSKMRGFIAKSCIENGSTDKEITSELNLKVIDALYGGIEAKEISNQDFKDMIISSQEKIAEHIYQLPETRSEMPTIRWNELLRYKEKELDEVDVEEDDMIWEINR